MTEALFSINNAGELISTCLPGYSESLIYFESSDIINTDALTRKFQ